MDKDQSRQKQKERQHDQGMGDICLPAVRSSPSPAMKTAHHHAVVLLLCRFFFKSNNLEITLNRAMTTAMQGRKRRGQKGTEQVSAKYSRILRRLHLRFSQWPSCRSFGQAPGRVPTHSQKSGVFPFAPRPSHQLEDCVGFPLFYKRPSHERQPSLPPRRRPVPSVRRCRCLLPGGHGRVVPLGHCGQRRRLGGGGDAGICLAGHGSGVMRRRLCRQCSTGAIHEQKVQEERRR